MRLWYAAVILGALSGTACGGDDAAEGADPQARARPVYDDSLAATLRGRDDVRLPPEELARGRRGTGWQRVVQLDAATVADSARNPEKFEQLSADAVNRRPTYLPVSGDVAGPSVLAVQILLDRALFSPGILDGHWGMNAEKAAFWFQRREGLPATGRVDQQTFERLSAIAGNPAQLVVPHTLTAEDVEGPFVDIPEDIYDKADLDCMCYESVSEKLAEMFHTSPEVLEKLNPEVSLDSLAAGATIQVPNVRAANAGKGAQIARLVISDEGHFVHALDAQGKIVYHFPTTLGSSYDPSPEGDHRVVKITPDPWWHYQPDIIEGAEPGPDAKIPPGPNSAVGRVWMALSIPHYGIHGTSAPETIGYATSAGCVRLTNWDATFLSQRIQPDTPVEFRDPGTATASADAP